MRVSGAQIRFHLKGVKFPASKAALIENAKRRGASDEVIDTMKKFPDKTYKAPADVWQALRKVA